MKRLLLSAALCTVALASWSGWRSGSAGRVSASGPKVAAAATFPTTENLSPSLSGGPMPGTATLQEWQDLMSSDPEGRLILDPAHMARVRELARGLSTADLRVLIEPGIDECVLNQSVSIILGTLIQELARRDSAGTCDLLLRKNYWGSDGQVFEEWGRQNPQAALAWIDAHAALQGHRYVIIRSWAENEPSSAFQALVDLDQKGRLDASGSESDRLTFFSSWAKKDPEAAVAACVSRPDLGFCNNANWGDALYECAPQQRERLLSALRAMPNAEMRSSALGWCALWSAASGDLPQAIALSEDEGVQDSMKPAIRESILQSSVQGDGAQAAAQWFWNSSPPDQGAETMQSILRPWAGQGDRRLTSPLAWLQSLPPGSLPDGTPQIFAECGFQGAPVTALKGWLTLQPPGEIPSEAIDRLGAYLSSVPRPTRLFPLLQQAGFPAELTDRILHSAGQTTE